MVLALLFMDVWTANCALLACALLFFIVWGTVSCASENQLWCVFELLSGGGGHVARALTITDSGHLRFRARAVVAEEANTGPLETKIVGSRGQRVWYAERRCAQPP